MNATDEIKGLVKEAKKWFPKLFINHHYELIFEPKNNIYFRLEDVENELDFKCKLIAWLSRPSCKGVSDHWQRKFLAGLNGMLGTNFIHEDVSLVYTYLGNDVNRKYTEKFIESNYDLSILNEEYKKQLLLTKMK